jgi:hypothetical protein
VTLPANVEFATVTGTFINLATGDPATGTVTFEPSASRSSSNWTPTATWKSSSPPPTTPT